MLVAPIGDVPEEPVVSIDPAVCIPFTSAIGVSAAAAAAAAPAACITTALMLLSGDEVICAANCAEI